ncbi:hypothetical protein [Actinomadura miaoliensis]|uniref:Uncharacterized protein n=1 Tax=Actinomadura miaoliensis TaxID=430685 RepID=A0ABP7VLV9_9ACTN
MTAETSGLAATPVSPAAGIRLSSAFPQPSGVLGTRSTRTPPGWAAVPRRSETVRNAAGAPPSPAASSTSPGGGPPRRTGPSAAVTCKPAVPSGTRRAASWAATREAVVCNDSMVTDGAAVAPAPRTVRLPVTSAAIHSNQLLDRTRTVVTDHDPRTGQLTSTKGPGDTR